MENCLAYLAVEKTEEVVLLQKYNPCIHHKNPWKCAIFGLEPKETLQKFQILSKLNSNVFDLRDPLDEERFCLPIDDLAIEAIYYIIPNCDYDCVSVLVRAYKIMINNMRRQKKTRFPIPKHVIMIIQLDFIEMLRRQYSKFKSDPVNAIVNRKALSFLLNALHMALSAGANIQQKRCTCGCIVAVGDEDDEALCIEPHSLTELVKPVNSNGVNYSVDPILFAKIAEFYEILFVHGNKPDRNWLTFVSQIVSFQKPELFKVGGMTLSLMDHEDWQHVQRKLSILHKRAVRSVPGNAEEEETKARKLQLIETYKGPKPLQDMCRKVLYDNVPDRRMVRYVGYLPLPPIVKEYLLFH